MDRRQIIAAVATPIFAGGIAAVIAGLNPAYASLSPILETVGSTMIGAGLTTWVVLWLTADKRTAQIGSKVEDNDIVQGGTVVATVTGATVDRVGSRAHFGQVSGGPYFNKELEFEFRALRLKLVNAAIVNNAAGAQTLFGVQCDIVPEAARWGK